MSNKKKWIKRFRDSLFSPENIAEKVVLAITVLLIGLLLSYIFQSCITPHPKIKMDCENTKKEKLITFTNIGRTAAEEVEIHLYSEEQCNLVLSLMESWNIEESFTNFSWYNLSKDKIGEYKIETLLNKKIWGTGREFTFACPLDTNFKAVIGGRNFPLIEKKC